MGMALPAESASLWNTIRREAVVVAAAEPALAPWMHEAVVNQSNLASALAQLIATAISSNRDEKTVTRRIAERAYRDDPSLIEIHPRGAMQCPRIFPSASVVIMSISTIKPSSSF